jgi:hypothetical protein
MAAAAAAAVAAVPLVGIPDSAALALALVTLLGLHAAPRNLVGLLSTACRNLPSALRYDWDQRARAQYGRPGSADRLQLPRAVLQRDAGRQPSLGVPAFRGRGLSGRRGISSLRRSAASCV